MNVWSRPRTESHCYIYLSIKDITIHPSVRPSVRLSVRPLAGPSLMMAGIALVVQTIISANSIFKGPNPTSAGQ